MRPGSVAFVIPNRNYGGYLWLCLQSVVEQTHRPDWVLIVDGQSTDRSRDVADKWGVSWISAPPKGIANARNIGIENLPDAEFIVPLDSDDWVELNYVERCLSVFRSDIKGDLGVVAPSLRWPNGRIQHAVPPFTVEEFLTGNRLFTCSMFRRRCWKEVGGYDEGPTYEDWEFWLQIVKAGWRIEALREPLFHYNPHEGSSCAKDRKSVV